MKGHRRDLVWLLLLLSVAGLAFQPFAVSHELDGQTYEASVEGFAYTTLEFQEGRFKLRRHTCTSSGEWEGKYRLVGEVLVLDREALPSRQFKLRKSAGRTYLDCDLEDYDQTLRLSQDSGVSPRPPRWQGSALRIRGLYPGMPESELKATLPYVSSESNGRTFYWSE